MQELSDINQLLSERLHLNGFKLSDANSHQIIRLISLLKEWNSKINLTGHKRDLEIIDKDIIDSLYLNLYIIKYADKKDDILDLGCGSGITGLLISLMNPQVRLGFIDANRKKVNFIKDVARNLNLNNVHAYKTRAEQVPKQLQGSFDLTITRATWGLEQYVRLALPYIRKHGDIIAMIGPNQKVSEIGSRDALENYGLEAMNYIIKPEGYKRKIFFIRQT